MARLAQTPGLTEVQRDILSTVREFVDKEIIPHAQRPYLVMNVVIRTTIDPAALGPSARAQALKVDPDQPVHSITTMEGLLDDVLQQDAEPRSQLVEVDFESGKEKERRYPQRGEELDRRVVVEEAESHARQRPQSHGDDGRREPEALQDPWNDEQANHQQTVEGFG